MAVSCEGSCAQHSKDQEKSVSVGFISIGNVHIHDWIGFLAQWLPVTPSFIFCPASNPVCLRDTGKLMKGISCSFWLVLCSLWRCCSFVFWFFYNSIQLGMKLSWAWSRVYSFPPRPCCLTYFLSWKFASFHVILPFISPTEARVVKQHENLSHVVNWFEFNYTISQKNVN